MKEERRFRVSQREIERDEEKRDGRKRKRKEKPYERERIVLEEERRKVRRLRESGKTCRGEVEKR